MSTLQIRPKEILNHIENLLRRSKHLDSRINQSSEPLSYDKAELSTLKFCISLLEVQYEKEVKYGEAKQRCEDYFKGVEPHWKNFNKREGSRS